MNAIKKAGQTPTTSRSEGVFPMIDLHTFLTKVPVHNILYSKLDALL